MDKKVERPSVWTQIATQVLDEEEQAIEREVEAGGYVLAPNQKGRLKELRKSAKVTLERKPVTIRIQNRTIALLKARALQEGMPYQTLAISVLHKYLSGRLKERE